MHAGPAGEIVLRDTAPRPQFPQPMPKPPRSLHFGANEQLRERHAEGIRERAQRLKGGVGLPQLDPAEVFGGPARLACEGRHREAPVMA
jgi:hypothetical protein